MYPFCGDYVHFFIDCSLAFELRMKYRKIVVNNKTYRYSVGKNWVPIYDGDRKILTDLSQLTGLSWPEIERQKHKKSFQLTPRRIADWLLKNG